MSKPIVIKLGAMTSGELDVLLTASMESGSEPLAKPILDSRRSLGWRKGDEYTLTLEQAKYVSERLQGDADRVAEACGEAAGRAFEKAGEKLDAMIAERSKP